MRLDRHADHRGVRRRAQRALRAVDGVRRGVADVADSSNIVVVVLPRPAPHARRAGGAGAGDSASRRRPTRWCPAIPTIPRSSSSTPRSGGRNARWHTDVTFVAAPPAASILVADAVPRVGRRHAVGRPAHRLRAPVAAAARTGRRARRRCTASRRWRTGVSRSTRRSRATTPSELLEQAAAVPPVDPSRRARPPRPPAVRGAVRQSRVHEPHRRSVADRERCAAAAAVRPRDPARVRAAASLAAGRRRDLGQPGDDALRHRRLRHGRTADAPGHPSRRSAGRADGFESFVPDDPLVTIR